jgi:23S rRNA (guanine1835-N2)-methyltransferase
MWTFEPRVRLRRARRVAVSVTRAAEPPDVSHTTESPAPTPDQSESSGAPPACGTSVCSRRTRLRPPVQEVGHVIGSRSELALESRVEDARSEYVFEAADGVCSKQSFRTPELLLADVLWSTDVDRLLVPEANYGVVGVLLAASTENVAMTESSARAATLCERNAAANGVETDVTLTAGVTELDGTIGAGLNGTIGAGLDGTTGGGMLPLPGVSGEQTFDAVAYAPKPYTPLDLGAQRIQDAVSRLAPGGQAYIAAAKHTGLTRYETILGGLAGDVESVGSREEFQVLRATVPGDTADGFESLRCATAREFDVTVDGIDLSLVSMPGVFSASELDAGTRLLAESADVSDGERVLDLCCGYGAVGTYAALAADCEVWLTDEDRVATACAEQSLHANDVEASVATADGLRGVPTEPFDRVLCNPPTHATDEVLEGLFGGARDVLRRGGELLAVHHRELDLRPQLSAFETVESVVIGDEHVVIRAQ